MWKIGNVIIKNAIVLAPMAGISNPAFIKICSEMGVGYAITELISAEALARDNQKTIDMLRGIDKLDIPVAVQLFGANPSVMALAAQKLVNHYKISIIDINMGCPVPKVALHSGSGSALMKDPDKVYQIVSAVVKSVDIPVTVKIRSGWDDQNINAVAIAKIIEQAGAKAISVHPRTRKQGYSGQADWKIIKEVKENVSIPVIGNGDIKSCYDAKRMIDETGCDAVMIGRGLLGNPWLIRECIDYLDQGINPVPITVEEKISMIRKHLDYLMATKPYKLAMLEIRTHAAHYLRGVPNGKELKAKIFQTTTQEELFEILDVFMEDYYANKEG